MPLTMREIQGLTIQVDRGLENLDRRLLERSKMWDPTKAAARYSKDPEVDTVCFRITATPVWPFSLPPIRRNSSAMPYIAIGGHTDPIPSEPPSPAPQGPRVDSIERPIVRGWMRSFDDESRWLDHSATQDGTVEVTLRDGIVPADGGLYVRDSRVAHALRGVLDGIEAMREAARAPSAEYVIDWEIRVLGDTPAFVLTDGHKPRQARPLRAATQFPRVSVSDDVNEAGRQVLQDLLDVSGIDMELRKPAS